MKISLFPQRYIFFLTFTFLLFLVNCQSDLTINQTPYPVSLSNFTNGNFYGTFIGTSKSFSSRNTDDSLFWNNCFKFSPPVVSNDLFSYVTYEWQSQVFDSQNLPSNHIFFPNQIEINATKTNTLVEKNYFVIRYDIMNNSLNDYASWTPVNDSDNFLPGNFRAVFDRAISDGSGTLNEMSVFLIVYFRNFAVDSTSNLKQVELNFGATPYFTPTSSLNNLSKEELRGRYEEISEKLVARTKELAAGLQAPFFSRYYEATNTTINPGSEHNFINNPITKTCP